MFCLFSLFLSNAIEESANRLVGYKLMKHQLVELDFVCEDIMYHSMTYQQKSR